MKEKRVDELVNHFSDLVRLIRLYERLFVVDKKGSKNSAGAKLKDMGEILKNSLSESITLRVCTLLAPPTTCGKKNLSISTYIRTFFKDQELEKLQEEINKVEESEVCKDHRLRRNTHIAHIAFSKKLTKYNIEKTKNQILDPISKILEKIFSSSRSIDYDVQEILDETRFYIDDIVKEFEKS